MQIKTEDIDQTNAKLTIDVDNEILKQAKKEAVSKLSSSVSVAGFRSGKVPPAVAEKHINPNDLNEEFINQALNLSYKEAVKSENIKVVSQPKITVIKFVPYSALTFTAEIEKIGEIKLGNYKNVGFKFIAPKILKTDIDEVIENLRLRSAVKKAVNRPAKINDQVNINFVGIDPISKDKIPGTDAKSQNVLLGSKTFISGFEEAIVGMKEDSNKKVNLTFPKNYRVAKLANKKVTFDITLNTIDELIKPKLDANFIKTVGPFKNIDELRLNIKKQLEQERNSQEFGKSEDEMVDKIINKSSVSIPSSLIESEMKRIEDEEKRNIVYRGETWQQHLDAEGISAEDHLERNRPTAEKRLKTGLLLGEISQKENITATKKELEDRLSALKKQYSDPSMQLELDKPESRQDIFSRLLIEKTLNRLKEINSTQN